MLVPNGQRDHRDVIPCELVRRHLGENFQRRRVYRLCRDHAAESARGTRPAQWKVRISQRQAGSHAHWERRARVQVRHAQWKRTNYQSRTVMKTLAAFLLCTAAAFSQDAAPDRVTVPFSDPSRPKTLRVGLINGGITVKGYDGKDAIVEERSDSGSSRHRRDRAERVENMRRIDMSGPGLGVEESENVIKVGTRSVNEGVQLTIQVPINTNLKLHTVNGGDIVVDHIVGDVELEDTNGAITATHISGTAVVNALNGKVLVSLDKISGDKPMSFSSLNGDIDVTLPADMKAKVKLKTDNRAVYSDFDIQMDASPRKPVVQQITSRQTHFPLPFVRPHSTLYNSTPPTT